MASVASARPVIHGFMLLDPDTPLAVIPKLQDYDTVNSEQAADDYILALHANHRMRFVMEDGPLDYTVEEHLATHNTDEDKAVLANALVAHMAHRNRQAYETHARAAFTFACLDNPDEDMINDIVSMPVEGGDNEIAAEEEGVQDKSVSRKVPIYASNYSTLSEARDVTYKPAVPRRLRLDLENDDVKKVNELIGTYVEKVYNGIRALPATAIGISRFEGRVSRMDMPEKVITSVSAMVVEQVLKLHTTGDHLRSDQTKMATAEDLTMKASQRLKVIIQFLTNIKLIAYDIVEGFDQIALFVAMPNAVAALKAKHKLQNAGRANTRNLKTGVDGGDEAEAEENVLEHQDEHTIPAGQKKGRGQTRCTAKTRTTKSQAAAAVDQAEDDEMDVDQTPTSTPTKKARIGRTATSDGPAGVKRKRAARMESEDKMEAGDHEESDNGDHGGVDLSTETKGKGAQQTETGGTRRSLRKRRNKD